MENFIQFFAEIPSSVRSTILISGLTLFFLLEAGIPLFRFNYNKVNHALLNLFFTFTTLLINLSGAFLILQATDYNLHHQWGLLPMIHHSLPSLPYWVLVLLGILLLDFIGAWFIHWLEHRVKWMWKFHIIHHTDPCVDVTTGLRHHPGESVLRLGFTILAVFISGASIGIVMLYQTLSAFFAQLTHANIKTPKVLDNILSLIFVTPDFHKVHHHFVLPETDRNYGNIFSLWDRIFQTAQNADKLEKLHYGLDTHQSKAEQSSLKSLLLIPFKPYRLPVGSKFNN